MPETNLNDYERKKSILKKYKSRVNRIKKLKRKIALIDEMLDLKGISYSDIPRGTTKKTKADLICEKVCLEQRIANIENSSKKLKSRIENAIDNLDDEKSSEIIELAFLEGMSQIEISYELNCDIRTVERRYSKAINEIDI